MKLKILFLFVGFLYSPEERMTCQFTFYNSYCRVEFTGTLLVNVATNADGFLVDDTGKVIRRGDFYFIESIRNSQSLPSCPFFCLESKMRRLICSDYPIIYSIVDGKIVSSRYVTPSIPPYEAISLNLDIVNGFVLDKNNKGVVKLGQYGILEIAEDPIFLGRDFTIVAGKYYQAGTQVPFDGFLLEGTFACYKHKTPNSYNEYINLGKDVGATRITNGELSSKDIQHETIERPKTSIVELDSVNQIMSYIIDGKEIETQVNIKEGLYVDKEGNPIKEGEIIVGQFFVINGIIYYDRTEALRIHKFINGGAETVQRMGDVKTEKTEVIKFDSVLYDNRKYSGCKYSGYMIVDGKIHLNPFDQVNDGLIAEGVFYSYDNDESSEIFRPKDEKMKLSKIKNGLVIS